MAVDQNHIFDILDEINDDGEAIDLLPDMSKPQISYFI